MRSLKSKIRPGTGVSPKGSERIERILQSARDVLIRQGYHGFTMRAVAMDVGMSVGNLNYYYGGKSDLLNDLLDIVIAGYLAQFDAILNENNPQHPEEALEGIIRFILEDIGTKETTVFFPELWALANHDGQASKQMHELYRKARLVFDDLIPRINSQLSDMQVKELSLFLSASLEGQTVFVGYKKPWAGHRDVISNLAAKSLLDLVRTVEPSDFANNKLQIVKAGSQISNEE